MNNGILLVVDGSIGIYRAGLRAAFSIKRTMPEVRLTWASSMPHYRCRLADRHIRLPPQSPFVNKISACLECDHPNTLFLDADTYLLRPVWEFLERLENFDFVICKAVTNSYFFNSGVLAFNQRGRALLERTHTILQAMNGAELVRGNREQKILTELIYLGHCAKLGIRVDFGDGERFNLRPSVLDSMTEAECERVHVLHAYDLTRPVAVHFPHHTTRLREANKFATTCIDELKTETSDWLSKIQAVIDENPDTIESYLALASLMELRGDKDRALTVLLAARRALPTEPGRAMLWAARLNDEMDNAQQALQCALDAAIETSDLFHPNIQNTKGQSITLAKALSNSGRVRWPDANLQTEILELATDHRCTADQIKSIRARLTEEG
ncbi:MAG: hypothetical protein CMQ49_13645 [Gammaproteobacteria bacterium]|nr:hypothetical protein [Gammaproteobacteria bacterium]|tara:strand:+ start:165 stop:1316 length:1152 start_codon:yes stop_codon:yes gene_type:complete